MAVRFVCSVVCLCVCACSGPEPEHFLWEEDAQSLDNPFPDLRTGSALRKDYYRPFLMQAALTRGSREIFDGYATDAAQLKGLGNFAPQLLRTTVPVDPASIPGHFARLRKTASGYEVLEASCPAEHSTATLDGTGKTAGDGFPEFVFVRPSAPLPEGDEGLLVVKKGVKTKDGVELGRGRTWDRAHDVDLAAAAKALGIEESDIVLALPLKAADVSGPFRAFKTFVDSPAGLPAATIPAKGRIDDSASGMRPVGAWASTDSDWVQMSRWLEKNSWARPATHVGRVVIGTLAARDPRENGAWKDEWVTDPSQAPVVALPFVLAVPSGPKPAGGWTTVIVAHGVAGRNIPVDGSGESYTMELAEWLAREGIAVIGIDAPSHGVRGNFLEFFDIESVPTMRENFREMTIDLMQVARAVPAIDADGDGMGGDLAPELGFHGNSLGAIMGSSFVALDDRVKYAMLNVPGGGLSNILVSRDNHDRIGLLMVAKTSIVFDSAEYHSAFSIIRATAQPFLEGADPINLFRLMPASRAALMQMGIGDQTIPNFTTADLGASGGLPEPATSSSGTTPIRALFRVDPQKYGKAADYNGHNVFGDIGAVRAQALDFLKSKGTTFTVPP